MQLYILTEGFYHTGYGHVARCMAIAKAFQKYHVDVSFVLNGDEQVLSVLCNYSVQIVDWCTELNSLGTILKNADIVLIDSYLASKDVYEYISRLVPCCIYLDDFNRLEYPSGIIVNGTVGAENLPYPTRDDVVYLLGGNYIILRDTFENVQDNRIINRSISTLLVTFGGTDPLNVTYRVLKVLVEQFPEMQKNVVLGAAFRSKEQIENIADQRTTFFHNLNADEMKGLMLKSDIAISAAGQTINELAVTGLPSVIFKVADNQNNNILGWIQNGFIDGSWDATNWQDMDLVYAIKSLSSENKRKTVSLHGKKIVDGKGADRIAKRGLHSWVVSNLKIRKAEDKDILSLFHLANDAVVRLNSFSTVPISWGEHTAWFQSLLSNPLKRMFVFYVKDDFVAQIRFDGDSDCRVAVVSISIALGFRGLGLASILLQKAIIKLREEAYTYQKIYAYVKRENLASQKTFLNAGFVLCESDNRDALKYIYSYES